MAQTIKDVVTWLKQWYYTEDEVDDLLDEKQDSLVSGTNIKTINNNSLLGSGNITIQGSGGDGSLTKITLADGYDLYVNDNNHLAMLHIHKSVSLSGQWNTLLASAIPLAYRPLGWLGIPDDDNTIVVGDDGGIYYNNFSGSSSKTLDNQVNWFFVGGTSSYNVALTSNKSILSYYNSESAILTATVTDDSDNPVANVTVEFFNGLTSMGTATTNSSGIATKTYASSGAGDVTFTAEANNITDTYTVEDCYYANLTEQSITNSSTTVYSALCTGIEDIMDSNFVLEFDINSISGNSGGLNIGAKSQYTPPSTANYRMFIGIDGTKFNINNRSNTSSSTSGSTISRNTYYHMKLTKNGGTFSASVDDDSAFGSKTPNWISNYSEYDLYIIGWTNANIKIKNIKLKPL